MTDNKNYQYYMPTRVIIGKDAIIRHSSVFKTLGSKALIVTGLHSAKRNGSEQDIKTALDLEGISYHVFDKVTSNPTIACAYEGAKLAREENVDFIIAIGGGSPMDAGKAIALLASQDIAEEDLFSGHYEDKVLPMAFVPTTAGTGAEVTQYAILTNEKAQTKTSIASPLLFPTVCFLDAKYTEDLPLDTTINTAIDALSHAIEGMMTVSVSVISDSLASESIKIIMNCLPDLLERKQASEKLRLDLKIREQLLQASCMAGMVIAQTGTTAVHAMGYSLTYFKDIDHGRANGLLLSEYLRFVEKTQPDLIARILKSMELRDLDSLQKLLDQLLGEKEQLSSEEINHYAQIAMETKNIANSFVKPNKEDICDIYKRSL